MEQYSERLHCSVGVHSVPAFSHILDLGWINMLYLLHLLGNNTKLNVEKEILVSVPFA